MSVFPADRNCQGGKPARMINFINSATSAQNAYQVSQAQSRQQPPKTQKSPIQEDTVTLKSTGDADHDGDSR